MEHIQLGYNYRLSEMQAALGSVQLARLSDILQKRKRAAQLYNGKLKDVEGIKLPFVAQGVKKSWFVYVIILKKQYLKKQRDMVIEYMAKKGIGCASYFQTIHLQPFYKKEFAYKKGDFPIAESISDRTIALPFFSNIIEKEVDIVVQQLKEALAKI